MPITRSATWHRLFMPSEHASQHTFRRIFRLAEQLEPDRTAIWDWLWHTPIEALGGRTAIELAFSGRSEQVVVMLETALRDHADQPQRFLSSLGRSITAP